MLLASLSGCRSARDNQIDILESELRSQEDYIYELEDYVVEYSDKLRGCRSCQPGEVIYKGDASESEVVEVKPYQEPEDHTVNQQAEEEPFDEPAEELLPKPDPPVKESLEETPTDPADIEVPDLDLEIEDPLGLQEVPLYDLEEAESLFAEDDLPVEIEYLSAEAPEDQLIYIPDPAVSAIETIVETAVETTDEDFYEDAEFEQVAHQDVEDIQIYRQAERIVITEILRGADSDALLTIVEARDAKNETAELDGMVSLMVMTKDQASRRRLKRWDFSEEETLSSWQASQLGDGLHLELPMGQTPLPEGTVELWARLMTNDGRKLLSRLPFNQAKLATLGEEPEMLDGEAAEQALAEALPLGGQDEEPVAAVEPKLPTPTKTLTPPKTLWRSSVQAAHLASESKTTSSSTNGWKASRQAVAQVERTSSTKKPVWTTGRSTASSSPEQR
jgi:hypothetical protein